MQNKTKIQLVRQLFEPATVLERQVEILHLLSLNDISGHDLAAIVDYLFQSSHLVVGCPNNTIDIVGTGGDQSNSINVSTIAAFLISGSGVPVAKHGNRSVTSRCGSFDCLQALQVAIPTTAELALQQIKQHDLTFLFAPYFHEQLKLISAARKVLAASNKKSIFNILGPLLNPAKVSNIVVGVFDQKLLRPMCEALQILNVQKAYVVHGEGMDEATVFGKTCFGKIKANKIEYGEFDARDLGVFSDNQQLIRGDSPETNAAVALKILSGEVTGAATDMVLLNAALALELALDFTSLSSAIDYARQSLQAGLGLAKLHTLQEQT